MKVAILGVWHVHADEYARVAASLGTVVGVWDENPDWCRIFATRHSIPAYESIDELLVSDAEAVVVCSATASHTDHIICTAQSGKHIFTEKVLALTERDCLRVRDAVDAAGVRFVISYPWKFR